MRTWVRNTVAALCMATAVAGLVACSTEKAKWANIQYHNTTCHYNVWWNGKESLAEGIEKLHKAVVDDYTQLLPVEKLGTAAQASGVNPQMDRAIEKGVKGIKKHSIYVKGEEHVPYIKECYLLTAYATFYKQDYIATANTCNILISQFAGTHAADEGAVLLARCMVREQRYQEAESTLDQLVTNLAKGDFSRKQQDKLYLAMVEATVPQERYKKAVEYIHLALDATHDRTVKGRLTFLMAQIYQQLGKRAVAAKYYHQVLGYRPEYVMEFNAKLGEASCADLAHSDLKRLERQLDDMLDDKKNEEYQDQIYYAKGEMYLGMKDAQKACDNYRKSVRVSTVNRSQKAKSAIRLAEVLYDVYEDYDGAQRYYDTAIHIIDRTYPHYADIKRQHDLLTELAAYTRTYERCDSLMRVAAMPEAERMALIKALIDTLNRQEQEAHERALLAELAADNQAQQNTLKGDWYFYNASTVQKGKETFRQRWGMRGLEDLWCLSNKGFNTLPMAFGDEPKELAADDPQDSTAAAPADSAQHPRSAYGNPDDPHSPAYYLKDLPVTTAQIDSIDSLTAVSLLGAGYLFYDGVHNVPRALECYLRLANDYTSSDGIVQAFYMLYRIYDKQGNTPQSNYYRDMVLMGFPDSDYANLIRDNEYYKELIRRDQRIEDDYAAVYTEFSRSRFGRVIALVDEAEETYASTAAATTLGRFRYWKGLSQARLGDVPAAIATLEGLIAAAPATDSIVPLAQAQLALLRSDRAAQASASTDDETITEADERRATTRRQLPTANLPLARTDLADGKDKDKDELPPDARIFRYRDNQQHYVVIIVNDKRIRATELQYRLADFNSSYYANSGYKVNALLFTDSTQMLTVHRFLSADDAMRYYNHLCQEESPLRQYAEADYVRFVISTQNYATFYNRKNVPAYMAFFEKYYLKQK